MTEDLRIQEAHLKKLYENLEDLLERQRNAGPGTEGDYKNLILTNDNERSTTKKKIELLKNQEQNIEPETLFIYIITNTNEGIRSAIGTDLFDVLNPTNHDNEDCTKWIPFTRDKISICELIGELRNRGYVFKEEYLTGNIGAKKEVRIEDDLHISIAVIDLLALDKENEKIAGIFNNKLACSVITPIADSLHEKVKEFMIQKRKAVFTRLEYRIANLDIDSYNPEITGKLTFINILHRIFKTKQPVIGIIKPDGSDIRARLSTQNNPSI